MSVSSDATKAFLHWQEFSVGHGGENDLTQQAEAPSTSQTILCLICQLHSSELFRKRPSLFSVGEGIKNRKCDIVVWSKNLDTFL